MVSLSSAYQLRKFYRDQILKAQPERKSDPSLYYGNVENEYLKFVNSIGPRYFERMVRPGNATVFLGDSITLGSDDPTNGARGDSWPVYASLISGQRIHYVRNAAIAGDRSAQMLSRFDKDVTPYKPSLVVLNAGMNDAGNNVPLATYISNIKALIAKIRNINAVPVLANTTPSTGSRRKNILTYNAWLSKYAESEGIILLDFYSQVVDPATGGLLATYDSGDNVHPNRQGLWVLGQYVSDTLSPLLPKWTPILAGENADPNNLLTGGLFMTDTNADGIGDGWARYSGANAAVTPSITTDANVLGKMQRITANASTSTALYTQHKSATGIISAGDRLSVSGVVTSSGIPVTLQVSIYATPNTNNKPVVLNRDVTRGVFYLEFTAPTGITGIEVMMQAGVGTGYVEFGRMGVYNLTKLGIV